MDMVENGKDVNEIMKMPYHFIIEIMEEKNKPIQAKSFFDLL